MSAMFIAAPSLVDVDGERNFLTKNSSCYSRVSLGASAVLGKRLSLRAAYLYVHILGNYAD